MTKRGRIAFITTPRFRKTSYEAVRDFVHRHLYEICNPFEVLTTGRTHDCLNELLEETPSTAVRETIATSMGLSDLADVDLERWRSTILDSLKRSADSIQGMIHITYELVEQRLDGVIHFTDWEDKSAKPDSAVLAREANVHDVPIAHDPDSARAHIRTWQRRLVSGDQEPIFRERTQPSPQPLDGLNPGNKVLALIAHDNMKLEICRFAVEQASHILGTYDYVLATGTTGRWIRCFLEAAGHSSREVDRIRLCNSGPMGGDIQIAFAVVSRICQKIVFLQDPSVSHPHDSDIRLFEQAALSSEVSVEVATNVESARLLVGR